MGSSSKNDTKEVKNSRGNKFPDYAECKARLLDEKVNPILTIAAQFEAFVVTGSSEGLTIKIPETYGSMPLVSENFVKRIGARAWYSTERRYKLPNIHFYCQTIIKAKLRINGSYYRVECGVVPRAKSVLVYEENGWMDEEGREPDLVLSSEVTRQAEETPLDFAAQIL